MQHDDHLDAGHLDAALDAVLVGGREERPVEVVDPDPTWPPTFRRHRVVLARALGDRARRIDHVGSTSVPGLAAKPIVDILVTVDDPDDEAAFAPALVGAGYELRVREPGHRMFRTPARDVHVHVWATRSDDERRHLLLRDWLRVDTADRTRYEDTKRALAARPWRDVNYYADAKSPVITQIMARAETWAAREAWRPG
ncbi:MAG TPA: GrpB family protein [Acidimicrobiales bacterium]